MSENTGARIPPPLRFEMGVETPAGEPVRAHLLVTVDEGGRPRVAVLAPTEIKAIDERRVAIAVRAGTSTERNLRRGSSALLWCVLDAAAYSLRGAVKALPSPGGEHAAYELTVEEALRDFYAGAPMIAGPTYRQIRGDL